MRGVTVAAVCMLVPLSASARVRHSVEECRAACDDRNVPASCAWLSPAPRRCLKEALKACATSEAPGPARCLPPRDLPACGTHHDCPYGALCVDTTCQVVGCGSHDGVADCTGTNRCEGDKCVVAECSAVTANCPKGFHCEPASPPFSSVSGTCLPDQPGVAYCAGNADCIALGNVNPTCIQGICTRQTRRLGTCQIDADCARRCRRGRTARLPRCGAAGVCLCTNCATDGECSQLLTCTQGRAPACLPKGACICRRVPTTTTTTTTTTTVTTTTDTTAASTTTTTLPNDVCCCIFETDNTWHCVHASRPSPYLCYVPWPECCDADYTVCE